ncbi:MAG TPA: ABC transporter substrate-binding protein [Candidatus Limiplasma sp.]|nr:ABC transporter substrate-binding protein [Candidatus Limiplasma sp.]
MKKLLALVVALALAASLVAIPALAEDTIKIGGIGVLTGPYAMYGVGVKNGVDLYIDEINAAGGIGGKKVEMLWEDSEGSPDKAANAYNKLVQNDGVCAILGPVLSGATDAVADLAAADGIPMITASATAYDITTDRPNVFRTCFLDPFQGKVMADFTSQELKATKVAAMYKNGDDYSVGLKDAFVAEAKTLGMEVVDEEASADKDVDFKTQLTNIKDSGAEVVFLAYYGDAASYILTQAKELGLSVKFTGGDGISNITGSISDKSLLTNMYYSDHFSNSADSEIVKKYLADYQTKYGEMPSISFSATAYDAAKVLCSAIATVGDPTNASAIVDAIKTSSTEGVTGTITFDDHNDPIKSAFILNFDAEGNQVFVKQQAPQQ